MKPGGADDLLTLLIYYDERPAAFQRLSEEGFEYIFFIAIALRVLFPDERVGRDEKKIGPIVRRERANLDELAF